MRIVGRPAPGLMLHLLFHPLANHSFKKNTERENVGTSFIYFTSYKSPMSLGVKRNWTDLIR
jgi:hypothetical protein